MPLVAFTRRRYIYFAMSEFGWTLARARREWRRLYNDPGVAKEENDEGETVIYIRIRRN